MQQWQGREPEVHLVIEHEVQHLGRHFIADIDAHLRITLPKLPQDLWQNIGAIGIAGRQGYMPPQALTERRNIGPGRLQAGQDRLRVLVQEFPCWRETQSRAMAYQERLTEFLLQGFHVQTNGRLRQSQARRSPGKTPLMGNLTKATQLV
jgi:hypothetical protein